MKRLRVGTALAFTGLVLSFALSWYLKDPIAFTATAPIAIGGKWWENITERKRPAP